MKQKKYIYVAKLFGGFVSFQFGIQAIDAISGLMTVRLLSKQEYAYFGIITTISLGLYNMITSGVVSFLFSEGSRYKLDKIVFSSLFSEINRFISKKVPPFFIISLPILLFFSYRNHVSVWSFLIILSFFLLELIFRVRLQLFQSVLIINNKFNKLQSANIASSLFRLLLLLILAQFLNTAVAYSILVTSYILYFLLSKYYANEFLIETKNFVSSHNKDLSRIYKSQFPIYFYAAIDSQIVIVVLIFMNNISLIADVNAAAKISLMVVSINAFINTVVMSKFANITSKKSFVKLESILLLCLLILYTFIFIIAYYSPNIFILLIGDKYKNISQYLYITIIGVGIVGITSALNTINFSRTWITKNWIALPFTFAIQIIYIYTSRPNTFEQIGWFIIFSAMPTLIVNIYFNYKGIKQLA